MEIKNVLLSLGNIYVETNYLGLETAGKDQLDLGNEYAAPKYEVRLGGSAVNFITQAKLLGQEVGLIGKSGDDDTAQVLLRLLTEKGIRIDLIQKDKNVQTNIDSGLIFAKNGQNIQIVAGSANQSLSLEDIDFKNEIWVGVKAVYFGGSFKQKNLFHHYPDIFADLKSKEILLFIDPGRVPVDSDSSSIDILKKVLPLSEGYFPNDKEILSVTNCDTVDNAIDVVASWGAKMIAVKLGPEGCLVFKDGNKIRIAGCKVDAISTVGAGDVFNAAFIFKYLEGGTITECAKFANAAAAFRVSQNRQPTYSEVQDFIEKNG